MTPVPVVRASGDPADVGEAHGAALGERLQGFLADGTARLDHLLPEPVPRGTLPALLAGYRDRIADATPALAREVDGLARGAGITADDALLLQVRREVLGYRTVRPAGDCTTWACAGPRPVLAQTVDLNGNLDDQVAVLQVSSPGRRRALVLSFGGLLGYLGLNDAGLAVGINLVLGGRWSPGLPPYLAIRHVLDRAASVPEAVDLLRGLPLASSRSVMLCDAGGTAYVEALPAVGGRPGTCRVVTGPRSVHTNHFLDPGLARRDELNPFALASSRRRLAAATEDVARLGPDADPEDHLAALARPPICVPDNGDVRRERTVAAVVLRPDRGELHLRPGDPSRSGTQVFALA